MEQGVSKIPGKFGGSEKSHQPKAMLECTETSFEISRGIVFRCSKGITVSATNQTNLVGGFNPSEKH